MTSDKTEFVNQGYEQLVKIVRVSGNTGRVYVPFAWIGRKVAVIRLTEEECTE